MILEVLGRASHGRLAQLDLLGRRAIPKKEERVFNHASIFRSSYDARDVATRGARRGSEPESG
jgi:hypothetical protein